MSARQRTSLIGLAWLSVAAALVTMGLKAAAWRLTGSVGLLSDAAESIVNLVAASVALLAVRVAERPPDEDHPHGHEKAEYLAAGVEGALILLASGAVTWTAVERLLHPEPIDRVDLGLALALVAGAVNLAVAVLLVREGRRHRSEAIEADGRHLLTDVGTSVGVVVGVALVALTGWERLDPIVALVVAAAILATGARLLRRTTAGLMDSVLPASDREALGQVLERWGAAETRFHAVRTRRSGRRSFVSLHVLVPGGWSVKRGHDLAERIEADIRVALPHASVLTHIEPIEDPVSFEDADLDRPSPPEDSTGRDPRSDG